MITSILVLAAGVWLGTCLAFGTIVALEMIKLWLKSRRKPWFKGRPK